MFECQYLSIFLTLIILVVFQALQIVRSRTATGIAGARTSLDEFVVSFGVCLCCGSGPARTCFAGPGVAHRLAMTF